MDKFLRGDDGLPPLLSSDALQAQLDSKVHKNDHAAHADTLSTHAATLGTINTALDGKQAKIVDGNKAAFLTTLGVNMDSKQDKIVEGNKAAFLTTLGLTDVVTTLASIEQRLTVLEDLTLPHSHQDDIEFTASLIGKYVKIKNTETSLYVIHAPNAPATANGVMLVDDNVVDAGLMSFSN